MGFGKRRGCRREETLVTMTENAIAKEIVDAAFRIHTTLGPGLLESVYDTVLAYELGRRGFAWCASSQSRLCTKAFASILDSGRTWSLRTR
jgi:hypothetical protein